MVKHRVTKVYNANVTYSLIGVIENIEDLDFNGYFCENCEEYIQTSICECDRE